MCRRTRTTVENIALNIADIKILNWTWSDLQNPECELHHLSFPPAIQESSVETLDSYTTSMSIGMNRFYNLELRPFTHLMSSSSVNTLKDSYSLQVLIWIIDYSTVTEKQLTSNQDIPTYHIMALGVRSFPRNISISACTSKTKLETISNQSEIPSIKKMLKNSL